MHNLAPVKLVILVILTFRLYCKKVHLYNCTGRKPRLYVLHDLEITHQVRKNRNKLKIKQIAIRQDTVFHIIKDEDRSSSNLCTKIPRYTPNPCHHSYNWPKWSQGRHARADVKFFNSKLTSCYIGIKYLYSSVV